jgi:hypothetical protein
MGARDRGYKEDEDEQKNALKKRNWLSSSSC